jgi:fatty acid desaturase
MRLSLLVMGGTSLLAGTVVFAWSPTSFTRFPLSKSGKQTNAHLLAIAVPMDVTVESEMNEYQELSSSSSKQHRLSPEDQWVADLDYEGFGKEVTALGKQLLKETGPKDLEHLEKLVAWRNVAALIGLATVWMPPNPITILALSTWTYASWTMVAHHTCHGGYNRVVESGEKFHSRNFALSLPRRVRDWLDWMQPEAWNLEHNRLHHYKLNEVHDPDLVQRNLEFVRQDDGSMILKYAKVFAFLPIWKWYYYAPNTFKVLQIAKYKSETGKEIPKDVDTTQALTVIGMLRPKDDSERALLDIVKPAAFFSRVLAPFFLLRFVFLPLPLLAIPGLGPTLFSHAMINLVVAELLTNIHGFVTIVTNHAGEDLYTFDDAVKPKTPSFYVRQIVGSANYQYGNDIVDFAHGFLNYQVEHHVWPDLSMLQYQRGAPRLKGICDKYGVPYVQESVFERLRKTLRIMVGKTTMRPFPTEYEPSRDKAVNGITWIRTNGAIDEEED